MSTFEPLQHATAELLAFAMCQLFPGTQLIGSDTSSVGFHYDFLTKTLPHNALSLVEEQMKVLAKQKSRPKIMEMMRENAIAFFHHHRQDVLADLLSSDSSQTVFVLQWDSFVDLCPTQLVDHPFQLGVFKLYAISQKENITRIAGIACKEAFQLKKALKRVEFAKKSDHTILGPQMGLFLYEDNDWIWLPKGMLLRDLLLMHPQLQPPFSQQRITLNTSSDPTAQHTFLFSKMPQEFPIHMTSCCHIDNPLSPQKECGLFSHKTPLSQVSQIFCMESQFLTIMTSLLQFIDKIIKIFALEPAWVLCPQLPPTLKNKEGWNHATNALKEALKAFDFDYTIDNEAKTFYGPRLEIRLTDALGRQWAGPYVAIDVTHLHRLKLRDQVIMITHSTYGSLDRFVALLLEQDAGNLPFWLAPEQVRVLPISTQQTQYAAQIVATLTEKGIRSRADTRESPLGEKIHQAERELIPFMIIVGDQEEKRGLIAVRARKKAAIKKGMTLEAFVSELKRI